MIPCGWFLFIIEVRSETLMFKLYITTYLQMR
jgi:hypothetical protein